MKSKTLQQKKSQAELSHNVNFVNFTFNDSKQYDIQIKYFPEFEEDFKNGICLIFSHKLSNGSTIKFMTIIWPWDFLLYKETTIGQSLRSLANKRIRLYENIFEYPYFDFEDQCFPNQSIKFNNKHL